MKRNQNIEGKKKKLEKTQEDEVFPILSDFLGFQNKINILKIPILLKIPTVGLGMKPGSSERATSFLNH